MFSFSYLVAGAWIRLLSFFVPLQVPVEYECLGCAHWREFLLTQPTYLCPHCHCLYIGAK